MDKTTVHPHEEKVPNGLYEVFSNAFYIFVQDNNAWHVGLPSSPIPPKGELSISKHSKRIALNHINSMLRFNNQQKAKQELIKKIL